MRMHIACIENLNYQEDYKAFVVTAIDKLNREAKATLELGVTGIKEGPSIVFDPESITYDELVGGDMPKTHFTVTSVCRLRRSRCILCRKADKCNMVSRSSLIMLRPNMFLRADYVYGRGQRF